MKKSWVTAKELASIFQVSIKTIRRAYVNGDLPIVRLRRMVRFDLNRVRLIMEQGGLRPMARVKGPRNQGAPAGNRRRRAQSKRPRSVKRGRNFQSNARRQS